MRKTTLLATTMACSAATIAAGCAVDEGEEIGSLQEEVSGGILAVEGQFDAVVDWVPLIGNMGCTATKIGAKAFLTAAHCNVTGLGLDKKIKVTKRVRGLGLGQPDFDTLTLTAFHTHPSYELSTQTWRSYDIAVMHVVEETPDIPTMPLNPDYFGDGSPQFRHVGYGCDRENAQESYMKQYADFHVAWRSYWYQEASLSADQEAGYFSHNILGWSEDSDDTCFGDSGGPGLVSGEIASIDSASWVGTNEPPPPDGGPPNDVLDPFQIRPRVSNVCGWIVNPGKNVFVDGSGGFLINGKSGKCAAVSGGSSAPGAAVVQLYCDGRNQESDDQFWRLIDLPSNWFALENGKSGLCLSAPTSGEHAVQQPCNGSNLLQNWRFEDNTQGVVRLRNRSASSICLGVGGGSTANQAPLGVYACGGSGPGANQSWVFSR
jgi:hypothetical protein